MLKMAKAQPDLNYLGLEIRSPLVDYANRKAFDTGLVSKVRFMWCNINVSLNDILSKYRLGPIARISIHFPDPYFKKRQHKRRLLQPELVHVIAKHLQVGGELSFQSDVSDIAKYMMEVVEGYGRFEGGAVDGALYPFPTERELATCARQESVYRAKYWRRSDDDSSAKV